jgi:hypothetical protein
MTLAQRLRAAIKKLRDANFSRDKGIAISEVLPVLERAAQALEDHLPSKSIGILDADLARALAALGRGTKFPGREFYINRPREFDAAIKALIAKTGFEEIKL